MTKNKKKKNEDSPHSWIFFVEDIFPGTEVDTNFPKDVIIDDNTTYCTIPGTTCARMHKCGSLQFHQ